MDANLDWAQRTFGHARLGNVSRVRRLVSMATALAQRPAGTVTGVFDDAAEREGAFRLLSSVHVGGDAVLASIAEATMRACRGRVYCAVDGTSMSVTDEKKARDVGAIGNWSAAGRGLQALTALVLDERGAPIGLGGVRFWARTERGKRRSDRNHPDFELRGELRHTIALVEQLDDTHRKHRPDADVWYQFDRGFDSSALLELVARRRLTVTIRASNDRRLESRGAHRKYLRKTVRRAPSLGDILLEVPARGDEPRRVAVLRVRATRVRLAVPVSNYRRHTVEMTAVEAKEIGRRGQRGLHWLLLTTVPAETLAEAQAVLDGYALRWRIEELHRTWKSGWCNVEQTQLRGRGALEKWATLHLAVASRAMRLAHLARTEPDRPAIEELTREEIDAVLILASKRKPAKYRAGETPPLGDLVLLLARLGGYVGKSSGGPPGATVIGRGLDRIASFAEGLRLMRQT